MPSRKLRESQTADVNTIENEYAFNRPSIHLRQGTLEEDEEPTLEPYDSGEGDVVIDDEGAGRFWGFQLHQL